MPRGEDKEALIGSPGGGEDVASMVGRGGELALIDRIGPKFVVGRDQWWWWVAVVAMVVPAGKLDGSSKAKSSSWKRRGCVCVRVCESEREGQRRI